MWKIHIMELDSVLNIIFLIYLNENVDLLRYFRLANISVEWVVLFCFPLVPVLISPIVPVSAGNISSLWQTDRQTDGRNEVSKIMPSQQAGEVTNEEFSNLIYQIMSHFCPQFARWLREAQPLERPSLKGLKSWSRSR